MKRPGGGANTTARALHSLRLTAMSGEVWPLPRAPATPPSRVRGRSSRPPAHSGLRADRVHAGIHDVDQELRGQRLASRCPKGKERLTPETRAFLRLWQPEWRVTRRVVGPLCSEQARRRAPQ